MSTQRTGGPERCSFACRAVRCPPLPQRSSCSVPGLGQEVISRNPLQSDGVDGPTLVSQKGLFSTIGTTVLSIVTRKCHVSYPQDAAPHPNPTPPHPSPAQPTPPHPTPPHPTPPHPTPLLGIFGQDTPGDIREPKKEMDATHGSF